MFSEIIEKNGDIALLTELNKIGLPIKPPYNTPPKDVNFSKLLAKFHKYGLEGRFLFAVSVEPDFKNARKNYLSIGYTPGVSNLS